MLKRELQEVTNELLENKDYGDIDYDCLYGLGLPDFNNKKKKYVTKACIVKMLQWQCQYIFGGIDYAELNNCLELLRKKVIMI